MTQRHTKENLGTQTTGEMQPEVEPMLVQLFADGSLPLPPVPLACLPALHPEDTWLFATHPAPPPLMLSPWSETTLEECIPLAAEARQGMDDARAFLLCGVSGHGVDQWHFHYVYAHATLRMGLMLPYGNAYSDPIEELRALNAACQALHLCVQCTNGGRTFGPHGEASLTCGIWGVSGGAGESTEDEMKPHEIFFCLRDAQGGILCEGDSMDTLLDFFQWCQNDEGTVPQRLWIRA